MTQLVLQGLASVVCLALPVCFSILVLVRSEAARALRAARHQAVAFAVDTQTSLVLAGDKPTVTPQMLAEWVGYLLDVAEQEGDEGCGLVAERCRASLAQRGYNLPVVRAPQPAQGRQQKWCGLSLVFYNGKVSHGAPAGHSCCLPDTGACHTWTASSKACIMATQCQ